MSIAYMYEIVSVDEEARCMEVYYSAEGHQSLRVGARLPFQDEAVEDVVKAYAPVSFWEEKQKQVRIPSVGLSGFVAPVIPQPEPLPELPVIVGAQTL